MVYDIGSRTVVVEVVVDRQSELEWRWRELLFEKNEKKQNESGVDPVLKSEKELSFESV